MTVKPGRVYEVTAAEFPIKVTISVKDLAANQAFVADTVLMSGGLPVGTVPVTLTTTGDTKSYKVAKPKASADSALSVINGFFPDSAPPTSRYSVDIEATGGDTARTKISPPAVNPGAAFLTFEVK